MRRYDISRIIRRKVRRLSRWEISGLLYVKVFDPDGGLVEDKGLVSDRVITDDFAEYYIDCLQGTETGIADFKYHDSGTGITAEAETDSALVIPTGIARVTGSQIEGANAKTYRTLAIITYDGAYDITEWGLFNAASAGTMMDRAVITSIPVVLNYQLQFTYDHVAVSGG